jgi:hypothetical protein
MTADWRGPLLRVMKPHRRAEETGLQILKCAGRRLPRITQRTIFPSAMKAMKSRRRGSWWSQGPFAGAACLTSFPL